MAACKVPIGGVDDWVGSLIPEVFDKLYWQKSLPRTGLNPMMVTSLGSTLIRPASRIIGLTPGLFASRRRSLFPSPRCPWGPLSPGARTGDHVVAGVHFVKENRDGARMVHFCAASCTHVLVKAHESRFDVF